MAHLNQRLWILYDNSQLFLQFTTERLLRALPNLTLTTRKLPETAHMLSTGTQRQ